MLIVLEILLDRSISLLIFWGVWLLAPLLLKLGRRQIAERRVDALLIVDLLDEASHMFLGFGYRAVFAQVDLLFFDGADEAFGVWVLSRL